MIYTVECGFAEPAREREWSEWYSGPKLASLLALPGWRSSQRFQAVGDVPAPWLAVHAVPGADFFASDTYRNAGGGNFADWGPSITNWARNLFEGMEVGPDVAAGSLLAVADVPPGASPLPGVEFTWLSGVGLDRTVPHRAVAVVPPAAADGAVASGAAAVRFYRPITPRMLGRG